MIEVADPSGGVPSGNPLARRPVLIGAGVAAAIVGIAVATPWSAASGAEDEKDEAPTESLLRPADQGGAEVVAEFQAERAQPAGGVAAYEEPITGPALQDPPAGYYPPPQAPPPRERSVEEDRALQAYRDALQAGNQVDLGGRWSSRAVDAGGDEYVSPVLAGDPSLGAGGEAARLAALAEAAGVGQAGQGADQARYAQKKDFFRNAGAEWPDDDLKGVVTPPRTEYEVKAGWTIPAIMESGINSDLPGQIEARVAQDVYNTATGEHLVIPQGSMLVGTYDNVIAFAQNRVLLVWTKLVFPNGDELDLEGMAGADPAGYAGFRDKVNRHVARRVGAALMLSIFNITAEVTRRASQTGRGFQAQSAVGTAVGESVAELGRQMVERELNVPNTLQIRPGYRFIVKVSKDIAFSGPYVR